MNKAIKTLLASALAVSLLVLSGCNTVKGIGADLERAGESIQKSGN